MKKAQEILEMVEGRLSSPLIFSFLISWFITNWEITLIILFGVDSAPLVDGEKQTLLEAIQSRLSWPNSFCWPFFFAFVYTFANPFVQSWISSFYTWLTRNTEVRNLNIIGEKGLIKAQKYIDTKNELYEQYERVQKITEEETKLKNELTDLKKKMQQFEDENIRIQKYSSETSEELRKYKLFTNQNLLNGLWKVTYDREGVITELQYKFKDSQVWVLSLDGTHNEHEHNLVFSNFNSDSGRVIMVRENREKKRSKSYFDRFKHKQVSVDLNKKRTNCRNGYVHPTEFH